MLTIWDSKFANSREVPVHPGTLDALRTYAQRRDELCPQPRTASFFVSAAGTRLVYNTVQPTFSRLARDAGLAPRSERCRPRLHDLRHYADGWVMRPAVTFELAAAAEAVLPSA